MTDKITELLAMLTYCRPHDSESEEEFLDKFIRPLFSNEYVTDNFTDTFGNIFLEVAGGSKTLFCAHSDTVHHKDGKQVVIYDDSIGLAYKDDGQPLGADDGAGIWLLMEIVRSGLPCWVAVFRCEERGGQGSKFAANSIPEFFKGFDRAVAFDRRGTSDIITHQAMGRCCSNDFADALSDSLNAANGLSYSRCSGGVYTDTAELTHLIPECTNVSVGYDREHSKDEALDVQHLTALAQAVLAVEWETLPTRRDPKDAESGFYGFGGFGRFDDMELDFLSKSTFGKKSRPTGGVLYFDEIQGFSYTDLLAWAESSSPDDIVETILGLTDEISGGYSAYRDEDEDGPVGFRFGSC